jgi:hypothetical protein
MASLPALERAAAVVRFVPDLPGMDRDAAALLLAGEVEVAGDVTDLVSGIVTPLQPDAEAAAALSAPAASLALATARDSIAREPDGSDLMRALRDSGLRPRDAMPAIRSALTGRAHGLPVVMIVLLVGAAACEERLAAALGA